MGVMKPNNRNMSTETIKRSDVGKEEAKEAETQPEVIPAQDESASKEAETPQEATGEGISDEIQSEESSNETENEETAKPEVKSEVDWEAVAKKERWKRQRKNEELEELRKEKAQPAQPNQQPTSNRPKRPKLYDPGIDGDEDKLDSALDQHEEEVYQWREQNKAQEDANKQAGEKVASYQGQIESYVDSNPGYGQAWEDAGKPKFPGHVDQALMRTDIGPQIEHYLFENPDKLGEVMKAEPIDAVMMISNIRYEISSKTATPKKGQQKPKRTTISDAPEPATQIRGSSAKEDTFSTQFPNASINRASA